MNSRFGLLVAVAVIFGGVVTACCGRLYGQHETMARICKDYRRLDQELSKAKASPEELAAMPGIVDGIRAPVHALQKAHCS
jgi:hypothetical protein